MIDPTTLQIFGVLLVSTSCRSTFGFGDGLIAVPLLALIIPIQMATPLVVLVSITIAGLVIIQDWGKIYWGSAAWMLVPTFAGIPLGVRLLTSVHQSAVKIGLGLLIILFTAIFLCGRMPPLRREIRPLLLICGFCAGILGGAFGMNGPPLAIYGTMRGWSPQHFRATLQAYYFFAGLVAMGGFWWAGLWVPTVTRDYRLALLVVVPAILLGRAANRRLRDSTFPRYIYGIVTVIGIVLIVQGLRQL